MEKNYTVQEYVDMDRDTLVECGSNFVTFSQRNYLKITSPKNGARNGDLKFPGELQGSGRNMQSSQIRLI